MKSSPFAKIFENRISEWEGWLNYTFSFSEFWVKVQSVWIYLEPIFSSPDILKRLPYEGNNQQWKKLSQIFTKFSFIWSI